LKFLAKQSKRIFQIKSKKVIIFFVDSLLKRVNFSKMIFFFGLKKAAIRQLNFLGDFIG